MALAILVRTLDKRDGMYIPESLQFVGSFSKTPGENFEICNKFGD